MHRSTYRHMCRSAEQFTVVYNGLKETGVAYPGVWDNRSTVNTKTRYDEDLCAEMQTTC